jgi:hypothetical protein
MLIRPDCLDPKKDKQIVTVEVACFTNTEIVHHEWPFRTCFKVSRSKACSKKEISKLDTALAYERAPRINSSSLAPKAFRMQ